MDYLEALEAKLLRRHGLPQVEIFWLAAWFLIRLLVEKSESGWPNRSGGVGDGRCLCHKVSLEKAIINCENPSLPQPHIPTTASRYPNHNG